LEDYPVVEDDEPEEYDDIFAKPKEKTLYDEFYQ
jgi:hypothetical protein